MEPRFFGAGGERLGIGKWGRDFKEKYLQSIIDFRLQVTFVSLGGNNLNQNIEKHEYDPYHYRYVMDQYMDLCKNIQENVPGIVIEMPQFPRADLRYSMHQRDYFVQVRAFNHIFQSRSKGKKHYWEKRCYNLTGVFGIDDQHLDDGVHLTDDHYYDIALDLFDIFVGPNVYHD